jgi:hypothetical protein
MKKLLVFLILLAFPLIGQTIKDIGNSTQTSTVPLDDGDVWTGYRKDVTAYNSVTVSVLSDDSATVDVQFGDLVNTVFTLQRYFRFDYLANDTNWTKSMPIVAPFYRVVITNAIDDSMTVFRVTSMIHKGHSLPVDTNAYISVAVEASALLDSIEVNSEEGNALLQSIETVVDTISANVKESNTLLEQIETELLLIGIDTDSSLANIKELNTITEQVETELLLIGVDTDSTLANIKEANYLAQHIDNNTDLLEQGIDSVNAETERIHLELIKKMSQTTGDSIEVNAEEINYLLQLLRTTLSTKVGQDTTEATLDRIHAELIKKLSQATGDSLEVNSEEINYLIQHVDNNTDGLEAKADSTLENVKESNTLLQTIRTATTSILYGQTEIVNQLLDDAPTLYTSTGFEIGNKRKVSFVLTYNETEVGNTVSGAVTLEVSPDNSNWYALNAFYNNAGTIVSTVNYTADVTDTFHLPEFVTYP